MRKVLIACLGLLMLPACGDNINPNSDDGVEIDANPLIPDAEVPPDAIACPGPAFGEVGGPCDSNDDCDSAAAAGDGRCYFGPLFGATFPPEGYCTRDNDLGTVCTTDADCGTGNVCADSAGYKYCLAACNCEGDTCPAHQDCFDSFNGAANDKMACAPGTRTGTDGTPCDGFYECNDFSACRNDVEFPGGECERYDCTVGDDDTCHGGHCIANAAPSTGTTCVVPCSGPSDCRTAEGYVCFDPDGAGTAQNYCRHPEIGDPCNTAADCGGAAWTCETGVTFTGGYCTIGACPTANSTAGCTSGSLCYDDPSEAENYCVDRCTGAGQGTCRTGYFCTDMSVNFKGCLPP